MTHYNVEAINSMIQTSNIVNYCLAHVERLLDTIHIEVHYNLYSNTTCVDPTSSHVSEETSFNTDHHWRLLVDPIRTHYVQL